LGERVLEKPYPEPLLILASNRNKPGLELAPECKYYDEFQWRMDKMDMLADTRYTLRIIRVGPGGGESAVMHDVSARSNIWSLHQPPPTHVEYPSGSPDFIITIAACTRGLPLMPHHWNGRTRRNGVVRAEPGASASAWLARRQADHGGRRSVLLTWECGEVASMIYCAECGFMSLCMYRSSSSFVLPAIVLTALHFSDADLRFSSLARSGSATPPRPTI